MLNACEQNVILIYKIIVEPVKNESTGCYMLYGGVYAESSGIRQNDGIDYARSQ